MFGRFTIIIIIRSIRGTDIYLLNNDKTVPRPGIVVGYGANRVTELMLVEI